MNFFHLLGKLSLVFMLPILGIAQTPILEKYIQIGIEHNLRLQKDDLILAQQELKINQAKANRLPLVSFDPSYILAAGGRRLNFPVGDLFNPAYQALNDLTNSNNFPTNLENVDEQLTPNNFHDTRVYVSYPLYNPAIYWNIKAQEQLISVEQAHKDAYKVELRKEIKVAYYNYFKTFEVLSILQESESLLKEVQGFNQKLVKHDKATVDILANVQYELEKIKSDRTNVLQQQTIAKAFFNSLINRDFQADIEKDANIQASNPSIQDINTLKTNALANRAELQQLENGIRANQIVTQINEKQLLPTVGVEASAGFQGNGYKIDSDQALATIAIGAKWTIFDGKKRKNKIQESLLKTKELQKEYEYVQQQIQLQVINAWHTLQAVQQKLQTEQAAVQSAQTNFNAIKKRYENEKALLIEVLDAQTKLSNAKISLSLAQYDILIKEAELERAVAY